jgi:hypothetical protein
MLSASVQQGSLINEVKLDYNVHLVMSLSHSSFESVDVHCCMHTSAGRDPHNMAQSVLSMLTLTRKHAVSQVMLIVRRNKLPNNEGQSIALHVTTREAPHVHLLYKRHLCV